MRKWQKLKHDQNWAIVGQNAPGFCALAKGWPFKPLGTLGLHSTLLRNVQLHSLLRVSQGPRSCLHHGLETGGKKHKSHVSKS